MILKKYCYHTDTILKRDASYRRAGMLIALFKVKDIMEACSQNDGFNLKFKLDAGFYI